MGRKVVKVLLSFYRVSSRRAREVTQIAAQVYGTLLSALLMGGILGDN